MDKFCVFCADSDGILRPKNVVRETIIEYWMKRDSLDRATAEAQIDPHMNKQPAWIEK